MKKVGEKNEHRWSNYFIGFYWNYGIWHYEQTVDVAVPSVRFQIEMRTKWANAGKNVTIWRWQHKANALTSPQSVYTMPSDSTAIQLMIADARINFSLVSCDFVWRPCVTVAIAIVCRWLPNIHNTILSQRIYRSETDFSLPSAVRCASEDTSRLYPT